MPASGSLVRLGGDEASSAAAGEGSLLAGVNRLAGTEVQACYQCGKCSGGCPLSFAMDRPPRQIMRLVQLGLAEEALSSATIWLCAGCHTCTARCPREVDVAGVMDALRILARRRGVRPGDRNIAVFHRAFLASVRRFGRQHELGLMVQYKLGTLRLTEDLPLGLAMLARGKLALLPDVSRGRVEAAAIIRESARGEGRGEGGDDR